MSTASVEVGVASSRQPGPVAPVRTGEAFWVWLRIAALSFGGPPGRSR
jgi:chromate transporter